MSCWKKIAVVFAVLAAIPVAGAASAVAESPNVAIAASGDDTPWG